MDTKTLAQDVGAGKPTRRIPQAPLAGQRKPIYRWSSGPGCVIDGEEPLFRVPPIRAFRSTSRRSPPDQGRLDLHQPDEPRLVLLIKQHDVKHPIATTAAEDSNSPIVIRSDDLVEQVEEALMRAIFGPPPPSGISTCQ